MLANVRGTKDFLPEDMRCILKIIDTARSVFERYGFEPTDTPRLEYYDLFAGRLGEGEKDIFKFEDKSGRMLALRFDQTASLVRVFATHPIKLPFKRYAIGKVWRYEEPQKGRYREFIQADIDTIGVKSVLADAEVLACMYEVFTKLGFKAVASVNNRKLVDEILDMWEVPKEKRIELLRIVDKWDKIGKDRVKQLAREAGFNEAIIDCFAKMNVDELKKMTTPGAQELLELFNYLEEFGVPYKYDPFIVRGLDYYTGPVYEIVSGIGTLAGGGRYDAMIKVGGKFVPACGMSIGVNRLYDIMRERGMIKAEKYLVYVAWVGDTLKQAIKLAKKLRETTNVFLNLEAKSLSKQLEEANKLGAVKVYIVGEKDLALGQITVRDMRTGREEKIPLP